MPTLLGRKDLDTVTEYEKPGRVAGRATLSVDDTIDLLQVIPIFSNNSQIGQITVGISFQAKPEINNLLGQRELDLSTNSSIS